MAELSYWNSAVTVTLTYNQKSLDALNRKNLVEYCNNPQGQRLYKNSLDKKEMDIFIQRLRRYMESQNRKFSFVYAGEYGDEGNTHRPHWHLVILGGKMSDRRKIFELWGKSDEVAFNMRPFKDLAQAEYIAKYIQKSLDQYYWERRYPNKKRPFYKTGRGYSKDPAEAGKHGIGYQYVMDNLDQIRENKYIRHPLNGHKLTLPNYYVAVAGVKYTEEQSKPAFEKQEEKHAQYLRDFYKENGRKPEAEELYQRMLSQRRHASMTREAKLTLKNPKLWHELHHRDQESYNRWNQTRDQRAREERKGLSKTEVYFRLQQIKAERLKKECARDAEGGPVAEKRLDINRPNGLKVEAVAQKNQSPPG